MNAKETLNLVSKPWCTLDDLMKLSGLGKNYASKLRKEIKSELEKEGYLLPKNLLPMDKVVNKLKINLNFLKKFE